MSELSISPVTITIEALPVGYRAHVQGKLAKINVKLAKLGAAPASVEFGPVVERKHKDEVTGWEWTTDEFEFVTVHGFEARHAGWTAVASLDHTLGDEAFATKFPGHHDEAIPAHYVTRGPVCDHCGIKIARNLTILFRHDDGRWTQVGTSCVLEYLGVDPSTVLWLAQATASLTDADPDAGGGFGSARAATPAEFLAAAAEATRLGGFVPSTATHGWPTKEQASQIVDGKLNDRKGQPIWPGLDFAMGKAAAADIMAWVAASKGGGEFMDNARIAAGASQVSSRTVGILAALPISYTKAQERKIAAEVEKAGAAPSAHIGTVGAKLSVVGTVIVERSFDGDYGTTRLVIVKMATGEEVGTFGSGATLFGVEKGDIVQFSGKVKAHEDGEYGKRTMLKLAKIAPVHADGTVLPDPGSNDSRNHHYGDHDTDANPKCYHCVTATHDQKVLVMA